MHSSEVNHVETYLQKLQQNICAELEKEDGGAAFMLDRWNYKQKGGGTSAVLENGDVFEKAGVNFSSVKGEGMPQAATAQRPELKGAPFLAMGVSIVLHPRNPYVPTTHCNVRYFCATPKGKEPIWWFGGGFDLTPYYGFREDAQHWHQVAFEACEPYGVGLYDVLKKQCDEYFYLKHRGETRGIGGLFFDDFNTLGFDQCFSFMRSVGDSFLKAYLPIVQRRKHTAYGEKQKYFQEYRRGRYVEFNLLYDRGTLFGIQSGGRTESILMSLPSVVRWDYNWSPEPGTPEAELYEIYLKPQDWLVKEAVAAV